MSFMTIALMGEDQLLRLRVAACAAQEGAARDGVDPDHWAAVWRRDWASAPNWSSTWESALESGVPSTEIGGREDVITDGMILSAVQPMKPFRLVGQQAAAPESAHTDAPPTTLTTEWSEILSLDVPAAGPWTTSLVWSSTSTSTAIEVRVNGEVLRQEPKDSADRNVLSITGFVEEAGTLRVEARKTSLAGVAVTYSASAWWLAAS